MKNFRALALLAAVAALSTSAMAQTYVGASAGAGNLNIDCQGAQQCDKSDTSFKLLGGYRFSNGLAAEVSYQTFGKATVGDKNLSGTIKPTAFGIGAAYQVQLSDTWGLVARLGVDKVNTEINGKVTGVGSATVSETKTQPYFGAAVNYAITKELRLELAVDGSKAEFNGEKGDVRSYNLGVNYSF